MMNLPAASAAPATPKATQNAAPAGAAGLPPPAANGAAAGAQAPASPAASAAPAGVQSNAAAAAAAPFGALLDAMADSAAAEESADGHPTAAAEAQAVATMLPAMGTALPPATPGATPASVAAVAAALAGAGDNALQLRQQAQANALAARDAEAGAVAARQAETALAGNAALLDARAALLAAARPLGGASLQAGAPAPAARSSADTALGAALNALQGLAADSTAAPVAAKDGASLLADSQRQPSDAGALPGFRSVLAGTAAAQDGDTLRLSGSPEQWQQPLRAALGDRLQLQLARNDERAVIRLEPPNMGSVEISVRHSGGALQVNIAASHSEVLRQLNSIGDAVRQDLSQKQFNEVAVTVSASNARSLAEGGQQQRQQDAQQQREQQRQPGRALEEGDAAATTFAMLGERE